MAKAKEQKGEVSYELIENKQTRLIKFHKSISEHGKKPKVLTFELKPGVNKVDSRIKLHPRFEIMCEEGKLGLLGENARPSAELKRVIKDTWEKEALKTMLDGEKREAVVKAIKAQLKEIEDHELKLRVKGEDK